MDDETIRNLQTAMALVRTAIDEGQIVPYRNLIGEPYVKCKSQKFPTTEELPAIESHLADLSVFRVDDNGGHPIACRLYVTACGHEELELEAINLPLDEDVRDLLDSKSAQIKERSGLATCRVRFTVKDAPTIRKLAKAVRRLVGRGRRYDERNWKWICPQTADALEQLAGNLAALRRTLPQLA